MFSLGLVAQSSILSLCNTGTDFQMHNWKGTWLTPPLEPLTVPYYPYDQVVQTSQWPKGLSTFGLHTSILCFFPTPTFLPPQFIPTGWQFQDFLFSWFCTFCSLSGFFSVFSYTWEACIYSSVIRLASPPLRTPLCSTLHLLRIRAVHTELQLFT